MTFKLVAMLDETLAIDVGPVVPKCANKLLAKWDDVGVLLPLSFSTIDDGIFELSFGSTFAMLLDDKQLDVDDIVTGTKTVCGTFSTLSFGTCESTGLVDVVKVRDVVVVLELIDALV